MKYKIPLFDLNYNNKEIEYINNTIYSKWISTGENVAKFEKKFAKHLNIDYAIGLTNCTSALHLALKILNINKNDEVIVPSLTFVATVNSVRYINATPVFADIKSYKDFSIDPDDIKRKITNRTKAIIVMHYGGFSCEIEKIKKIAEKNNLFLIEDCAHSPSSDYSNKKLGSFGDISCFSFFANKNITCAEGGLLATNNKIYAEKANLLKSHGMTSISYERAKGHATEYDVVEFGYNYRLDDIRASLLLAQFTKLKRDIKKRHTLWNYYLKLLSDEKNIIIPYKNHKFCSSHYIFSILLKNSNIKKREYIRKYLAGKGIQTSVHYPSVHKFSIYKKYSINLPKTEYVSNNEITLPMYPALTKPQIKFIIKNLKDILYETK